MKGIKIGLLGCGTVGTGVAKLLLTNQAEIRARLGADLILKYVADVDHDTDRGIVFEKGVFVRDAAQVVNDPEIDIIIEMIGGQDVAKDMILQALKNGKAVVTANKALLAEQGHILFKAAIESKMDLAFEASVGGCMPVIKTVRESLAGNRISAMTGILNGTCNYILSKITDDGSSFETALSEAQAKGFAEADPTLDVEGHDAAHKLAILTALAFGTQIDFKDVYVEGISKITPLDIQFARQFGYRVKLLAISKCDGKTIEARVHPTMIPEDNLLSNVNGSLNAVTITGDAVGDMLLYGYGAGMMPTASAVLSDTIDIARNLLSDSCGRVPLAAFQADQIVQIPVAPISAITTHFYLRFAALDRPGVLSAIAGVLGDHGISIQSVHQKGRKVNGSVPIVILTHLAGEADVQKALAEIAALEAISGQPTLIRIEDKNSDVSH
jgi:homoserine dehydrogenase